MRSIDPFLVWLIAAICAASLFPAVGVAAQIVGIAADVAIALLFFLHGAKLSRAAIAQGAGNWRLHLMVLCSTYVVFPIIGLTLVLSIGDRVSPLLLSGLLYLTLLPSTVQSSIAFTAIAGGNVAAAVCSASLSNLLGIFLTPTLVGLLMHASGTGSVDSAGAVKSIVLQLLLPFVTGHLMRPLIGGFIDRYKGMLQPVDRSSVLLVVYSAFSAAVIEGIWSRVGVVDLITLLAVSTAMLAFVMGANVLIARTSGLPREDFIVLLFCGSKKSMVSGVPMAGALFPPAQVGLIILPLMIFHQLQLFACALLASRFRTETTRLKSLNVASNTVPSGETEAAVAATRIGMVIHDECMPGITANLALLASHAATLRGKSVDGPA